MEDDSFNFDDGWGDDDDLEIDDVDIESVCNAAHAATAAATAAANVNNNANVNANANVTADNFNVKEKRGLHLGEKSPEATAVAISNSPAMATATVTARKLSMSPNSFDVNDGWDDDNDLDFDDENNDIGTGNDIHIDSDNDNDNFNTNDNDNDNMSAMSRPASVPIHPPTSIINPHSSATMSKVEQHLIKYISDLTSSSASILSSINNKFQNTKNTNTEAALELCRYYHNRPQLTEYTIDVEVPRMDYQIILSDEQILINADEIQEHFRLCPIDNLVDDMLLRSSNQSLLADIFPMITSTSSSTSTSTTGSGSGSGDNGIIRSEFFATAVATKCRFVLDMREERTTQVECTLVVSVPYTHPHTNTNTNTSTSISTSTNDEHKLEIASVRLMVQFSPEPSAPYIKYHLVSIDPMLDVESDTDREKIHTAAKVLEEMIGIDYFDNNDNDNDDEFHQRHDRRSSTNHSAYNININLNQHTDTLRDNFLQSIATTQSGFRSALRDIDGVVKVSSKLDYLKKVSAKALPVLPSADDIIRASEVGQAGQVGSDGRQNEEFKRVGRGLPPPPPPPRSVPSSSLGSMKSVHPQKDGGESVASFQSQQSRHPTPPPPPPPHPPIISKQKQMQKQPTPRPIIGGLLLSGISQLAEAVAAPSDDKVPGNSSGTGTIIPKLYRNDDELNESRKNHTAFHRQQEQQQQYRRDHGHEDNLQSTIISRDGTAGSKKDIGINSNERQANMMMGDGDILKDDGQENIGGNGWSDDDDELEIELALNNPTNSNNNKNNEKERPMQIPNNHPSKTVEENETRPSQQKQLGSRQKHLIAMMKGMMETKIVINNYVDEDFVYDESTGIIPTRRRFVSRSDMLASHS